MNAIGEPSAAIDLAHEPDFRLGGLLVHPSACRVTTAGGETRVEPRVMEVLIRLVRSRNQTVTRDELIESCWGGRFVGDDAVSRVIYQVRNLARGVEPVPFALETVPKVGFRLVVQDQGEPATDTADVQGRGRALLAAFGRPRLAAALALALAAMVAAGAWLASLVGGPAVPNGRVEVMLFEPLQSDPALKRYSVALSDAVVRLLTSNGVEAAQRPTARDAGGRSGDAEFRVAGTVDRDGSKYVVNAQVLDRRTGDVLWSGRFDRDAAAAVDFQEEAANRIADGLDCALWHRAAGRKAMTSEVLALFLNACVARRGTPLGPREFVNVTERLVRAAPDLSYAHSLHAVALALTITESSEPVSDAAALNRALEAAAQRALQLDRRNGEAYLALGARYAGLGHWFEREQAFTRAAELSPTLRVVGARRSSLLREVGRWQEAEATNRRTAAADPFSPSQLATLVLLRAAAGDLAEAEALTRRVDLLDPEMARQLRYTIAFWSEAPDRARTQLVRYAKPNNPAAALACHEAYLDRLAQARGAPLRGLPAACDSQGDWRIRMLAREGDVDGAYAILAAHPQAFGSTILFFYPAMKAFRQDPRFMPLAHRLGLVDYWVKSGHWPDFCAEPDLPYDCKAVATALAAQVT